MFFGSHDISFVEYGVKLFLDDWAQWLITSGGLGKITKNTQKESEADRFAKIAEKLGVPQNKIIIENKSTNTRENIVKTREILEKNNLNFQKLILICKPYHQRRVYMTFQKVWLEVSIIVLSSNISFEEYLAMYPKEGINKKDLIALIVGEIQRIRILSEKRLITYQKISVSIWNTYNRLVKLGYTKYLWK